VPASRSFALPLAFALTFSLALAAAPRATAQSTYSLFESGPVRPVAVSPNGQKLFVVDTPDARLEVFRVDTTGRLTPTGSVAVGLEPVTVVARSNDEVWVVNHLSDSVSIVDVPTRRVVRTLLVGDEPRDLVFAGPGRGRAFITTAHRGQHRTDPSLAAVPGSGDPQLTTPGVGRADVWVFDTEALGNAVGGTPTRIVTLFGDTPRGLAVSPDGATVYVGILHSGNQTTTITAGAVCVGFDAAAPCTRDGATMPGGSPGPATNYAGVPAPHVGLIVKYDATRDAWLDELDRDWSGAVRFDLPDQDVFALDAATLTTTRSVTGVGTTLFNLAVNPVDGTLYVSNQDARNEVRFEGPGTFAGNSVRGHLAEARITVITPTTTTARHLNRHIPYGTATAPAGTAQHSLAIPVDLVVSPDGATLYVAAFGSSRVGVIPTAALAAGTFDPTTASANYLEVTGGGPAGLALDDARDRLYVLTRFDNAVSVVDLATRAETAHVAMATPEPAQVIAGRRFLYDARTTSANGEASCASCHVFGDLDHLAWDLGNPDDDVSSSPIDILLGLAAGGFSPPINGTGRAADFHPMKGPMTTQTLRGMVNSGAMHWRGDRSTGFYGDHPNDTRLSFRNFVVAFEGLVGRAEPISDADMETFTNFALALTLPPNPVRPLDNSLSAAAQRGRDFYTGDRLSDGVPGFGFTCNGCHELDPAQAISSAPVTKQSFENEPQILKVPHLRNAYTKVGMFGMIQASFFERGDTSHQGPQIRGFGFLHDGSTDTLFRFFSNGVFNTSSAEQRDLEAFMMVFPTDFAPVVGQQVTLSPALLAGPDAAALNARVDLLIARAAAPFTSQILGGATRECDLVAWIAGVDGDGDEIARGHLRQLDGTFLPDDGTAAISSAALRAQANVPGQTLTYSCAPPGSGQRMARDRDLDLVLNGLDNCPGAPNGAGGGTCTAGAASRLGFECTTSLDCGAGGFCSVAQEDADLDLTGDACEPALVPEPAGGLLLAARSRRSRRPVCARSRTEALRGSARRSARPPRSVVAALGARRGAPRASRR
jgi:YVTN family beta-propeller protein